MARSCDQEDISHNFKVQTKYNSYHTLTRWKTISQEGVQCLKSSSDSSISTLAVWVLSVTLQLSQRPILLLNHLYIQNTINTTVYKRHDCLYIRHTATHLLEVRRWKVLGKILLSSRAIRESYSTAILNGAVGVEFGLVFSKVS